MAPNADIFVTVQLELDSKLLKTLESAMLPNETLSDTVQRLIVLGLKAARISID